MSQQQAQESQEERYQHNVYALVECLTRGVNEESVHHLAYEAGVPWDVIISFLPNEENNEQS